MGIYFGYGAFGSLGAYDNYDKSACKKLDICDVFGYNSIYRWLGAGLPISALFSKILLMLGYGLTFTAVGYYLFRFKEC